MSWTSTKWLTAIVMLSCIACSYEMVIRETSDKVIWFGKLIINPNSNAATIEGDQEDGFQSDQSASSGASQLTSSELQRLNPTVQCDGDSMSLNIQGQRLPNLMVDSDMGPVPLNQMPSYCGISVKRSPRSVNVVAKYDCCNTAQGSGYVLPLVMAGATVKMACPASPPNPTASCKPTAMVIDFGVSTDSVKVKVSGVWQSLAQASSTCGFTLMAKPTGWQVTAPYTSRCWTIQGGQRRLSVLHINNELLLTCPVNPPAATAAPTHDVKSNPGFPVIPYPYAYQQPWPFGYVYPSMHIQSPSSHPSVSANAPSSDQQVVPALPQIPQAYSAYPYVAQGSGVQKPLVPYTNQQSLTFPAIQTYDPSTLQQVVAQYSPLPVYYPLSTVNAQVHSVNPQSLTLPASDQAITGDLQNVRYVQYNPLPVKGWSGK